MDFDEFEDYMENYRQIKMQCFTDGYHADGKFKKYGKYAKNPLFILNTRPLNGWFYSIVKFGYTHQIEDWYPPTPELFSHWILKRKEHYADVLEFFQDRSNNLIIVDISKKGWESFVAKYLGYEDCPPSFHTNVTHEKDVDSNHLEIGKQAITLAYQNLNINTQEQKSSFIDHPLTNLYKNNLGIL